MAYFTNISLPDKNSIKYTYDYLKQFDKNIIVTIINLYFNDDEKINILRDINFINDMPSELIELMLNNMQFKSVFNMIQNKELLNKINLLNLNLDSKDNLFIPNYLESKELINKTHHLMLKNMLININKENAISYLKQDHIINKLSIDDIVDIAIYKNIDLYNDILLINKLDKEKLIKYIDGIWQHNFNLSIINNDYSKKILFNKDINLDEIIYIYEYINTKSILTIQGNKHSYSSFNAIVGCYQLLGIDGILKLMESNDKLLCLDDFTYLFKDIDIDNLKNNDSLKDFIFKNYNNYLNSDLNHSLGSVINNYDDTFINKDINEIDKLLPVNDDNKLSKYEILGNILYLNNNDEVDDNYLKELLDNNDINYIISNNKSDGIKVNKDLFPELNDDINYYVIAANIPIGINKKKKRKVK